jgi:hypothetical protein
LNARARARQVFDIGAYVVVASVAVQFLLAGLGVFSSSEFFWYHANINGAVVFFLPLLLIPIGWYARVDRMTVGLNGIIAGLVIVQSLLLFPYHMALQGPLRLISGFHALNALLIFWVALQLMDRVRFPRASNQLLPIHGEVAPKAPEGLRG